MEAKDFRIGNLVNYVLFPNVIDASVQVVVSKISETHVTIKEWEVENTYPIENFAPILLTEEWLLNFGFYYSEALQMYLIDVKKAIWICWSKKNGLTLQDVNSTILKFETIKSVHQLQNLFYEIKGKELKIKDN
ncbi:hypothetical protein [Chryseobacterium sp. M5A1_1a]